MKVLLLIALCIVACEAQTSCDVNSDCPDGQCCTYYDDRKKEKTCVDIPGEGDACSGDDYTSYPFFSTTCRCPEGLRCGTNGTHQGNDFLFWCMMDEEN